MYMGEGEREERGKVRGEELVKHESITAFLSRNSVRYVAPKL